MSADDSEPTDPAADAVLDREHLSRMTFGDRDLEREVLGLFSGQAAVLAGRLRGTDADALAAIAHTLKGSACGVGAWRVARAAEALEAALRRSPDERGPHLQRLSTAVTEAIAAVEDRLRGG